MGVKICRTHGPLEEFQTSVHKRAGRDDIECRLCVNARANARYASNPYRVLAIAKKSYSKNKERILARVAEFYVENTDLIKSRAKAQKLKQKVRALTHYSGGRPRCRTCSEDDVRFLCLGHRRDDGAEHRKTLGFRGNSIYLWVVRNGFPDMFDVLCHNCNFRKYAVGIPTSVSTKWRRKLKLEVMMHYSGGVPKCAVCGESDIVVLTVDNVNGDGAEHRRKISAAGHSPSNLYRHLRDSGYPGDFRVLCQNHNLGAVCQG
jgi:hypothetical protein